MKNVRHCKTYVGTGLPDGPSEKFDLDGQIFP